MIQECDDIEVTEDGRRVNITFESNNVFVEIHIVLTVIVLNIPISYVESQHVKSLSLVNVAYR